MAPPLVASDPNAGVVSSGTHDPVVTHAADVTKPRGIARRAGDLRTHGGPAGVATFVPGLEQFEGKAFGARLVGYPAMMLIVPAIYGWWARRQRPGAELRRGPPTRSSGRPS